MATLTIRDLPESTRRALKARAAGNNRSMEAEVRSILQAAVGVDSDFIGAWLSTTDRWRGDFETPPRSPARSIDLA